MAESMIELEARKEEMTELKARLVLEVRHVLEVRQVRKLADRREIEEQVPKLVENLHAVREILKEIEQKQKAVNRNPPRCG